MTESAAVGTGGPSRRAAESFATELRLLREKAGSPSYRQLAKQTHFSASTLAEAVSGRRLPSAAVVRALALAYGADPEEWVSKLARATELGRRTVAATSVGAVDARPAVGNVSAVPARQQRAARQDGAHSGRHRWLPRLPGWLSRDGALPLPQHWVTRLRGIPRWAVRTVTSAALLVAGMGIGLALAPLALSRASGHPAETPTVGPDDKLIASGSTAPATDGQDPVQAGCGADARVMSQVDVIWGQTRIGVVQLKYSNACQAGWARLYLTDGAPQMFATVTIAAGDGTGHSDTWFVRDRGPAGAVYTNVQTPHNGCLSASATLEPVAPQRVSASTPCTPPVA